MRTPGDAAASAAAMAHARAAQALVVATGSCREDGHPLNELQQIALATALLTCMDGLEDEIATAFHVFETLRHGCLIDQLLEGDTP